MKYIKSGKKVGKIKIFPRYIHLDMGKGLNLISITGSWDISPTKRVLGLNWTLQKNIHSCRSKRQRWKNMKKLNIQIIIWREYKIYQPLFYINLIIMETNQIVKCWYVLAIYIMAINSGFFSRPWTWGLVFLARAPARA